MSGAWVGQTVLITGASSGLGRGMALELARRGADIIATARRKERLEALQIEVEALGRRCLVVPADATEPDQVQAVLDQAFATFDRIDVALLNAGGGDAAILGEVDAEGVKWQMRKNYDTLVNFLCPLIDHMKERGGTLAYTSSPAGFFGIPKSGPYSASKAAGRQLFDCARIDLAHTPIQFITLFPGFTLTEGLDADDVGFDALIISEDRAVREMVWALERGRSRHMFPKRIAWLIRLGTWLPNWLRERVILAVA